MVIGIACVFFVLISFFTGKIALLTKKREAVKGRRKLEEGIRTLAAVGDATVTEGKKLKSK